MAPIRVGIVGYGFAAKSFHLPFITALPAYQLVAVLQRAAAPTDSKRETGVHCTLDYPHAKHHRSADTFFADPDIELVVVATQTDTHADFARKALLAGKNVIVDKPFAVSAEEADGVIALAEKTGRIVTCFQNRRWDGDFQTLLQLKRDGALGDVMEAEIHYDFESPSWLSSMSQKEYTPGLGMTYGLGTHSVDHAYVLFGRPQSVTAFNRTQRDAESELEDSFTIILQYGGIQKRLLVTIKTGVTTPMAQQLKLFVRGTGGSYIKFQQRSTCPQEEHIAQGIRPLHADFGSEPEHLRGVLATYESFDNKYQAWDPESQKYVGKYPTIRGRWIGLYENLADAINGKAELIVKATQARDVLRIIELARESHVKGMTIPWK